MFQIKGRPEHWTKHVYCIVSLLPVARYIMLALYPASNTVKDIIDNTAKSLIGKPRATKNLDIQS